MTSGRGGGPAPAESGRSHLVALPGLTPPAGGIVTELDLADGTRLRTARWSPDLAVPAQGAVLICQGRSEFIEKYFEVIGELLARNFAVVAFDWRGQGLSSRALVDRTKGHVADFRLFAADLDAVIARVMLDHCPRPFYALAHSMGGTVMIHHAHGRGCPFERIVLSAPMVEVHQLPNLRRLVAGLARVGLSRVLVPQGRRTSVFANGFESNLLTSDPERFATMVSIAAAEPALAIGAPTVGWLDAAYRAMVPCNDASFCDAIATPTLVVVPGADRVISVPAMERFARHLRAGSMVRIADARHEVLMERDGIRAQFWAAFDAFVPGSVQGPLPQRGIVGV